MKNINNVFLKIKRLINDKKDYKKEIDGFYFNEKAIDFVEELTNEQYFLNGYYDLTISDILNMVDDASCLDIVKKNLLEEYTEDYSNMMYDAFLEILKRGVTD